MIIKKIILTSLLTASSFFTFSQTKEKEDETKMVREIIPVQIEKPKVAAVPTPPPVETTDKHGKKKIVETPPPVEAAPDTTSPMIPAPVSELAKRAQGWSEDKPVKYTKSNCTNSGSSVICQVSFPYKVKELNPTDKVEGEITMTVTIEAKEGKYRYTINNIKHKATVADASGGDIYVAVPECGSMTLSDLSWKHIKSAAFADAKLVADDLKAKMAVPSGDGTKKDDW